MSPTGFKTLYTINCTNGLDRLWVFRGEWGEGQGHKFYHSLLRSTEKKNEWSYTFAPLYAFMARIMIIPCMTRYELL